MAILWQYLCRINNKFYTIEEKIYQRLYKIKQILKKSAVDQSECPSF